MEGGKKSGKVTQMPQDRTWRQTGAQLRQEMQERQERPNCEYMNSQAQKALERLRKTREA